MGKGIRCELMSLASVQSENMSAQHRVIRAVIGQLAKVAERVERNTIALRSG